MIHFGNFLTFPWTSWVIFSAWKIFFLHSFGYMLKLFENWIYHFTEIGKDSQTEIQFNIQIKALSFKLKLHAGDFVTNKSGFQVVSMFEMSWVVSTIRASFIIINVSHRIFDWRSYICSPPGKTKMAAVTGNTLHFLDLSLLEMAFSGIKIVTNLP